MVMGLGFEPSEPHNINMYIRFCDPATEWLRIFYFPPPPLNLGMTLSTERILDYFFDYTMNPRFDSKSIRKRAGDFLDNQAPAPGHSTTPALFWKVAPSAMA